MTTKQLITLLELLDPDGTAEVIEERTCELRLLRAHDVQVTEFTVGVDLEDGGAPARGPVVIFKSWA